MFAIFMGKILPLVRAELDMNNIKEIKNNYDYKNHF